MRTLCAKVGIAFLLGILALGVCSGGGLGRTTITLWTDDPYSNEGVAAIRKVIDGFEKANPDIEVKWIQQTPTSYYEKLLAAFAGGVGPDVFYIRPGMDSSYQRQGLTYDINSLVERDKMELNVSDFLEPQLRELKIGGKWWCLPYDYSSLVLAYNADAFENAGLLPPSPAWTWDNVIDAGNKLMRRDSSGKITFWGFGGMGGFLSDWCEGFIMSFGGRLFNDELTKSVASSVETVNALSLIPKMAQLRIFPLGEADMWSVFNAGKAGMDFIGTWGIWDKLVGMPDFNFDLAMLPNGLPGKRVVSCTGGAWAISAKTRYPEASWKFVKWLVSPESQRALMIKCSKSLPARKSLINEWVMHIRSAGNWAKHATVAGEQIIKYGRNISPVGFKFAEVTYKYFVPLASGQISPTEAALRIEQELNVALRKAMKR